VAGVSRGARLNFAQPALEEASLGHQLERARSWSRPSPALTSCWSIVLG
jgi:hypothetical protein